MGVAQLADEFLTHGCGTAREGNRSRIAVEPPPPLQVTIFDQQGLAGNVDPFGSHEASAAQTEALHQNLGKYNFYLLFDNFSARVVTKNHELQAVLMTAESQVSQAPWSGATL